MVMVTFGVFDEKLLTGLLKYLRDSRTNQWPKANIFRHLEAHISAQCYRNDNKSKEPTRAAEQKVL